MNKKLQSLIDEFSKDAQARFPGATVVASPRHRKSAWLHIYADMPVDDMWEIVREMTKKEVDTLVRTGYAVLTLPHQRQPALAAASTAVLREKSPEWHENTAPTTHPDYSRLSKEQPEALLD